MKNNPFVVFATAFLVVMGSGLAIAAIGGPSITGERLDESSFAVDFGGELEAGTAETSAADSLERVVGGHDAVGAPEKLTDQGNGEAEQQHVALKVTEEQASKVETPKAEEGEETDESTWIEVLAPANGRMFEDKSVVFEGKAEPGAEVYAGEYRAESTVDGVWRIVLFLAPGSQTVWFEAIDAAGNRATDSVTVSFETIQEKPKSYEFTVHQKYVESHERFEKFSGTGTPGIGVVARSEFGVAETGVGENGEWWLPIEFSGLTGTTTFPITISTSDGFSGTYWFTHVAKVHEFSAGQKYGSSAGNPPYDVFWGTGVPGSVVEVGSPHGGARVEVGEGGWWELKVFFETAPVGETFDVVVADSLGNTRTFAFTRLEAHDK